MSYQEKNATAALLSNLAILAYFGVKVFEMQQAGTLNSTKVFSLWGWVMLFAIVAQIAFHILAHIVFAITESIRRGEEVTEIDDVVDERDKLIELKAFRNSYFVFQVGFLLSILSLVFLKLPALVMVNALIGTLIIAEVIGNSSQLFMYRRGY